jgi:amino-acid N-acetyltransferase
LPETNPNDDRPTLKYSIRQATEADLPSIQGLLQPFVAARKLLKRTRAELLTLISNGFVAELLDEHGKPVIVGFSAVEIYSRKLSEVQSLAVADGYQGHGIGSALVRACVERAREKGVLEVMAISASDSFLRNLGFDYSLPDQKRALFYQLKTREQLYSETEDE